MTATRQTEALVYSPFLAEAIRDPHPLYRRLRAEAPAYYIEEYDGWALSRFADCWRATADPQTFSSVRGTTAAQALSRVEPPVPSINQLDPPDHTRLRKAVQGTFSRAHVRAFEAEIRASRAPVSSAVRMRASSTWCESSRTRWRPASRAAFSTFPRRMPGSSPGGYTATH